MVKTLVCSGVFVLSFIFSRQEHQDDPEMVRKIMLALYMVMIICADGILLMPELPVWCMEMLPCTVLCGKINRSSHRSEIWLCIYTGGQNAKDAKALLQPLC